MYWSTFSQHLVNAVEKVYYTSKCTYFSIEIVHPSYILFGFDEIHEFIVFWIIWDKVWVYEMVVTWTSPRWYYLEINCLKIGPISQHPWLGMLATDFTHTRLQAQSSKNINFCNFQYSSKWWMNNFYWKIRSFWCVIHIFNSVD